MNRRGQSVLEYVIMLTAIIGAIVLWQSSSSAGSGKGVDKMVSKSADTIKSSSTKLVDAMFPGGGK